MKKLFWLLFATIALSMGIIDNINARTTKSNSPQTATNIRTTTRKKQTPAKRTVAQKKGRTPQRTTKTPAARPTTRKAASKQAQVAQVPQQANLNPNQANPTIGTTRTTIVQGDITKQNVDAIVNAANEDLSHGGGVAAAIARAAGPELQKYSNAMPIMANGKRCPTGSAVITPAFNLEKIGIKNIIHATGPHGSDPDREQLLRDAYQNSLQVAEDNNLRSIAFPAISTAIFGYDINDATPVAFTAVKDYIKQHPNAFDEIRFVLFSGKDLAIYQKWADKLLK